MSYALGVIRNPAVSQYTAAQQVRVDTFVSDQYLPPNPENEHTSSYFYINQSRPSHSLSR